MEWGLVLGGKGLWGLLISILFFFIGLRGEEFYDRSGDLDEEVRVDKTMWLIVYEACNERINGCKELGVIKSSSDKARGMDGVGDTYDVQVERSEPEDKWEESSLAKFNQFLGFPTEGLEKEILNFFIKIRKRREKIHSKELLECSINYEGGIKQKGSAQGKGRQIVIVQ